MTTQCRQQDRINLQRAQLPLPEVWSQDDETLLGDIVDVSLDGFRMSLQERREYATILRECRRLRVYLLGFRIVRSADGSFRTVREHGNEAAVNLDVEPVWGDELGSVGFRLSTVPVEWPSFVSAVAGSSRAQR